MGAYIEVQLYVLDSTARAGIAALRLLAMPSSTVGVGTKYKLEQSVLTGLIACDSYATSMANGKHLLIGSRKYRKRPRVSLLTTSPHPSRPAIGLCYARLQPPSNM